MNTTESLGGGHVNAPNKSQVDNEEPDWLLLPCGLLDELPDRVFDECDRTEKQEA